ncbi:hypothetical protein CMUS01_16507 [Colletotrichum musicola]|uniref:Uncharacterized protein n=2 Tax=Colletotrichum orchidearum species complex TaxID=2707337 RepID=A0A8H6IMI9_9PEZI|nr:hypothetical protein CMUS01_16507 [Colletotrichum musicola]KAF6828961.1 hypothetical protein CPLU01_08191 [Colletotrichum plurivorum]
MKENYQAQHPDEVVVFRPTLIVVPSATLSKVWDDQTKYVGDVLRTYVYHGRSDDASELNESMRKRHRKVSPS